MEVMLSKALWAKGMRFRKNVKSITGKPDLAIKKYKIAVFVDSEFFHGKDWSKSKYRIKTNRPFWWKKIEGNIQRDVFVNKTLKKDGWSVVRFWSGDVNKRLTFCVNKVTRVLQKKSNGG